MAVSGVGKLHAVLGGFHLGPAPQDYVDQTVTELERLDPDVVIPMHCTGTNFLGQCIGRRPIAWSPPTLVAVLLSAFERRASAGLAPRSVATVRRGRRRIFGFGPLPAFQSSQQAVRFNAATCGLAGLGFRCLRPLAAQLLHTRTDRREIIGGTGSGHVSSLASGRAGGGSDGLWADDRPSHPRAPAI